MEDMGRGSTSFRTVGPSSFPVRREPSALQAASRNVEIAFFDQSQGKALSNYYNPLRRNQTALDRRIHVSMYPITEENLGTDRRLHKVIPDANKAAIILGSSSSSEPSSEPHSPSEPSLSNENFCFCAALHFVRSHSGGPRCGTRGTLRSLLEL